MTQIVNSLKRRVVGASKKVQMTFAALIALALATTSTAMVAPAAGSFAFDLYDVAVNQILTGAPGFVGGVLIMVIAGLNLTRNWVIAVAGLLGGTILINADTLVTSMGYMI